jgi:hypothetical protein
VIPGGAGTFTSFGDLALAVEVARPAPPPIHVAFSAVGASQQGVYLTDITDVAGPNPPPIRIADSATTIPDGAGAFTGFGSVAVAVDTAKPNPPPIRIAFLGTGSGQQGVFVSEVRRTRLCLQIRFGLPI